MGPIHRWPEWVQQLSVFAAVGHPCLDWPTAGRTMLLLALAVPGALLAAVLPEDTPKVVWRQTQAVCRVGPTRHTVQV